MVKSQNRAHVDRSASRGDLPLYHIAAVPEYLRRDHIHTHYRAHYSLSMCARSLFAVHNDTGNVWTHLLGAFLFILAAVWVLRNAMPLPHGLTFAAFFVGALGCLGLSAVFHLCAPHADPAVYARMLRWDYWGISALVVGSFFPPAGMIFVSHPTTGAVYTAVIVGLAVVGFVGPMFPTFLSRGFTPVRVGVYVALVALEAVPLAHAMGMDALRVYHPFLSVIAASVAVYGVGVVIYVSRVPECLWPGQFDVWGHSHQIWHVCCVLAATIHLAACYAMYQTHIALE